MSYQPPVKDMAFVLKHVADMQDILNYPAYADFDMDIIDPVLDEAAKLAANVWAPLNRDGDTNGAKLESDHVKTTPGFKDAYWQYVNGGWNALPHNPEFGGQGLPWSLSMATNEMWQAANLSLGLCPLLTQAGIEALEHHGSEYLQKTYLEKLVSGEWAGTMNLTEPQAGTDLAAIRTIAKKDGDHYLLSGQKIYITYGDHEFTENIIHLVLAKIEGLPDDNRGLGLFLVPKFMVGDDGSLGERNDVWPVSLEHKLGIHGSPTCVMAYGDKGQCRAYLVGHEGEGLKNMFTMMNNARISVGVQGVSIMDRAYQHALQYAKERVQSFKLGGSDDSRVPIIEHADVRRMLLTMKAYADAGRALSYYAGAQLDRYNNEQDADKKKAAQNRADFLTPLVKAWCTDMAVEVSSLGIQVHGGMGFIEETGAAQFFRDSRILPIYEGTNGIQAADFMFRKFLRDQGAEALKYIDEMKAQDVSALPENSRKALGLAVADLKDVTEWLLKQDMKNLNPFAASSTLYLRLFASVAAGFLMARLAVRATGNSTFERNKKDLCRFYIEALMPQSLGLCSVIKGGQSVVEEFGADRMSA